MNSFSWPFFFAYLGFSIFAFYQKLHLKNFAGAWKWFETLLVASVTIGSLTGIGLLIYYAIAVAWWPPLAMFLASLVFVGVAGVWLERRVGAFHLSMAGFIGWPVCTYLMYASI